jgi:hypothetical protein
VHLLDAFLDFLNVQHRLTDFGQDFFLALLDHLLDIVHVEPSNSFDNRIVFLDSSLEAVQLLRNNVDFFDGLRVQLCIAENTCDSVYHVPGGRFHVVHGAQFALSLRCQSV